MKPIPIVLGLAGFLILCVAIVSWQRPMGSESRILSPRSNPVHAF